MTVAAGARARSRDSIAASLRASLGSLLGQAAARGVPTLVAATIAIEAHDPVTLFSAAAAAGTEPALWSQPDRAFSLLAIGASWRSRGDGPGRFDETAAAWSQLSAGAIVAGPDHVRGVGPLLVGGFGFSSDRASSPVWLGFEGADMVLPRLLVTSTPHGTWLTASVVTGDDAAEPEIGDPAELWEALAEDPPDPVPNGPVGAHLRITATQPKAPEWRSTVARFAGAVGRGRIDKVVLARQIELLADATIDIPAVLRRLSASAPESTVFAVNRGERTFLGATPERLVSLSGREFDTLALAGSTRRAADADGDRRLAQALLASDKEQEEHAVVVAMLRRTLAPIAAPLAVEPSPSVVRLRHVQHLATGVHGTLREPSSILALVARLHPTPAVGGAPRELALELIEDEEPTERGWYAGPLGWVDEHGDGEFVVALRSGVVQGRHATLFAGCGIVADSDPDREWDESLVKLLALSSALGTVDG